MTEKSFAPRKMNGGAEDFLRGGICNGFVNDAGQMLILHPVRDTLFHYDNLGLCTL